MKIVFLVNNNFTEKFYYYIFFTIFFIFISSEIYIKIKTKYNSEGKTRKDDRGSMCAIILGVWLSFIDIFYWTFSKELLPSYFQSIGLLLMLIGICIRIYSVESLGKAFTLNVCTGCKQKIIKTGIYKLVRHPAYLGTLMTIIGTAVAFRNTLNLLIVIVIISLVHFYRIKVEEKALIKRFGNDYLKYKNETKYIIPKIL